MRGGRTRSTRNEERTRGDEKDEERACWRRATASSLSSKLCPTALPPHPAYDHGDHKQPCRSGCGSGQHAGTTAARPVQPLAEHHQPAKCCPRAACRRCCPQDCSGTQELCVPPRLGPSFGTWPRFRTPERLTCAADRSIWPSVPPRPAAGFEHEAAAVADRVTGRSACDQGP